MTKSVSAQYENIDFSPIQALTDDEVITHSRARAVRLP